MRRKKIPILWTPTQEFRKTTALYAFATQVKHHTGFDWQDDYQHLHAWSVKHKEQFWSLLWDWAKVHGEQGEQVLVNGDDMLAAKFFPQGKLNFAHNLLHNADERPAIVAYTETGEATQLTRAQLREQALSLANWMQNQGIGQGDCVAAYLPNTEHTVIAMLATAAIGAIFSSCSPDFGLQGVCDRFSQIQPKLLFGTDGYVYGGKEIDRRDTLKSLIKELPSLQQVVVVPHLHDQDSLTDSIKQQVPTTFFADTLTHEPLTELTEFNFREPLYILYSSGTTGVPKCIVHSAGGTLLQHIKEHRLQSNIKAGDTVCFYTTCGWMMWHWLCSALASEATIVLYEGNPLHPPTRLWDLVEAEKITLLGVSAKYIDAMRKAELKPEASHDLTSLRTLCATGSPLSRDNFAFAYKAIKQDLHLASISGGTDIVSCFVLGVPTEPVRAGEIQAAGLGMDMAVLDDSGEPLTDAVGELCCQSAFPAQPIKFWNDEDNQKYHAAYFAKYPNVWCHGDWATQTSAGGFVIQGRSDATLNPGGVRIGTAEIYRITNALPEITESLVIGQRIDDDVRIVLFVCLAPDTQLDEELQNKIKQAIKRHASPRHVPAVIIAVTDIPRTFSGKISELAVSNIVHGQPVTNTNSLANPQALDLFKNLAQLN